MCTSLGNIRRHPKDGLSAGVTQAQQAVMTVFKGFVDFHWPARVRHERFMAGRTSIDVLMHKLDRDRGPDVHQKRHHNETSS